MPKQWPCLLIPVWRSLLLVIPKTMPLAFIGIPWAASALHLCVHRQASFPGSSWLCFTIILLDTQCLKASNLSYCVCLKGNGDWRKDSKRPSQKARATPTSVRTHKHDHGSGATWGVGHHRALRAARDARQPRRILPGLPFISPSLCFLRTPKPTAHCSGYMTPYFLPPRHESLGKTSPSTVPNVS